MSPRRRGGFTLLEIILALGLAIAAIGAALAFYYHVMDVRQQLLTNTDVTSSRRLMMQRMTDELRSAMVYPFLPASLSGQSGQMQFMTTVLPGPAAWAVRQATEDPIPPEQDLRQVTYSLSIATDENGRVLTDDDGNLIVYGLDKTTRKYLAATSVQGQDVDASVVSPYIKFLSFRYWDGTAWQPQWSGRDLPLAVEIVLGFKAPPPDTTLEDYPHETVRRVVYLPGGRKALTGTAIIRGLETGGGS